MPPYPPHEEDFPRIAQRLVALAALVSATGQPLSPAALARALDQCWLLLRACTAPPHLALRLRHRALPALGAGVAAGLVVAASVAGAGSVDAGAVDLSHEVLKAAYSGQSLLEAVAPAVLITAMSACAPDPKGAACQEFLGITLRAPAIARQLLHASQDGLLPQVVSFLLRSGMGVHQLLQLWNAQTMQGVGAWLDYGSFVGLGLGFASLLASQQVYALKVWDVRELAAQLAELAGTNGGGGEGAALLRAASVAALAGLMTAVQEAHDLHLDLKRPLVLGMLSTLGQAAEEGLHSTHLGCAAAVGLAQAAPQVIQHLTLTRQSEGLDHRSEKQPPCKGYLLEWSRSAGAAEWQGKEDLARLAMQLWELLIRHCFTSRHFQSLRPIGPPAPLLPLAPQLMTALALLLRTEHPEATMTRRKVYLSVRDTARALHALRRVALAAPPHPLVRGLTSAGCAGLRAFVAAATRPGHLAASKSALLAEVLGLCGGSAVHTQPLAERIGRCVVRQQGIELDGIMAVLNSTPLTADLDEPHHWGQQAEQLFPIAWARALEAEGAASAPWPRGKDPAAGERASIHYYWISRWLPLCGRTLPADSTLASHTLIPSLLWGVWHPLPAANSAAHHALWLALGDPFLLAGTPVPEPASSELIEEPRMRLACHYACQALQSFPLATPTMTLATAVGVLVGSGLSDLVAVFTMKQIGSRISAMCSDDTAAAQDATKTMLALLSQALVVAPPRLLGPAREMVTEVLQRLPTTSALSACLELLYDAISKQCGPDTRAGMAEWYLSLIHMPWVVERRAAGGASLGSGESLTQPKAHL
ncbi:unnamed protein product [Chrysoparadoxa australica]